MVMADHHGGRVDGFARKCTKGGRTEEIITREIQGYTENMLYQVVSSEG